MDIYRTEEEQIAAIKTWWKSNGPSLLLGVGLSLVLIFGWKAWNKNQDEQRSQASALYQDMLAAMTNTDAEKGKASVLFLAGQLRDTHADSAYAVYGALLQARQQTDASEFAKAMESLNWARAHAKTAPLQTLIELRLAQAQFANGEADAALASLKNIKNPGAYEALLRSLEGDILRSKDDLEGARKAYARAAELTKDGANVPLLDLKMADLGMAETP